jgi:hypothetical protein
MCYLNFIREAFLTHWARVVGFGPVSLCVMYNEGMCPSSGDINRMMMMMIMLMMLMLMMMMMMMMTMK